MIIKVLKAGWIVWLIVCCFFPIVEQCSIFSALTFSRKKGPDSPWKNWPELDFPPENGPIWMTPRFKQSIYCWQISIISRLFDCQNSCNTAGNWLKFRKKTGTCTIIKAEILYWSDVSLKGKVLGLYLSWRKLRPVFSRGKSFIRARCSEGEIYVEGTTREPDATTATSLETIQQNYHSTHI